MDPKNVFVINDGVDTTIYENHVCQTYKDCIKFDISTWVKDLIDTVYVHNSSNNPVKRKEFTSKILEDVIKVMTRKFVFKPCYRHLKILSEGSSQLKLNTLYLSAAALVNGKCVNILHKCFDIQTFSVPELIFAEIYNQNHVREIYENSLKHKPPNTSHVIFTFLFKNSQDTLFKFRIIEALPLTFCEELDGQVVLNKEFEDIVQLFKLLDVPKEHLGSLILVDETTIPKNSEHVFKFLRHVCKSPVRNNDTGDDKCQELAAKNCADIDIPVEETPSISYTELKRENLKLKTSIQEHKKKIMHLMQYVNRNKENLNKKTSREILDKLSDSHSELIKSQQEKYEQIISITKKNHDDKIATLTDYYNERIKNLDTKLKSSCKVNEDIKNIQNDNKNLKGTVLLYQEKLANIQNLVLDRPATPSNIAIPKLEWTTPKDQTAINSMKNKIEHYEKQVKELQNNNEQLVRQLHSKDNTTEHYLQQIKYLKDVIADGDKTKKLLEQENFELNRTIENTKTRHNEQFVEYDKLLKKRKQENDLHKREIMRLREHYNSENYTSPAFIRNRQLGNIYSSPNIGNLRRRLPYSPSPARRRVGRQSILSSRDNITTPTVPSENNVPESLLAQGTVDSEEITTPAGDGLIDIASDVPTEASGVVTERTRPLRFPESIEFFSKKTKSSTNQKVPTNTSQSSDSNVEREQNSSPIFPDNYDFFDNIIPPTKAKFPLEMLLSPKSTASCVTLSSTSSSNTVPVVPESQQNVQICHNTENSIQLKSQRAKPVTPNKNCNDNESSSMSSSNPMASLSIPSTSSSSTMKTGWLSAFHTSDKEDNNSTKSSPVPVKRPRGRPRKKRQ